MNKRMNSLMNWLKEINLELAFINTPENVFYLTGFETEPHERLMGIWLLRDEEPIFIVPKMEVSQVHASGFCGEIIGYEDHEDPWELLQNAFVKRGLTSIQKTGLEKDYITLSRVEQIQKLFPEVDFVTIDQKLHELRSIKDEKEIEIIAEASKFADYGVEVGIHALKKGCTELEVLAKIEYELKKKGIREMSFSTMVLFGENSGNPHGIPGEQTLNEGNFVLFDLGVKLNGYCSDITRTVVFKEVSEKQEEMYNTVLMAQLQAIEESKPGVRIGYIDETARSVITNAGYGEFFPHRLGHGLGINVHEYPSINKNNDCLLEEGMVFTIEPGIYVPKIGGVRIEDDVVITKQGPNILTKFPKELYIKS